MLKLTSWGNIVNQSSQMPNESTHIQFQIQWVVASTSCVIVLSDPGIDDQIIYRKYVLLKVFLQALKERHSIRVWSWEKGSQPINAFFTGAPATCQRHWHFPCVFAWTWRMTSDSTPQQDIPDRHCLLGLKQVCRLLVLWDIKNNFYPSNLLNNDTFFSSKSSSFNRL